jgi:hypothetical protein
MTSTEVFLWGLGGSVAVEVATVFGYYSRGRFPQRYRRKGFWVCRFLMAVIGGGLAVAYAVDSQLLAANIGASAPLIMMSLSQGLKN